VGSKPTHDAEEHEAYGGSIASAEPSVLPRRRHQDYGMTETTTSSRLDPPSGGEAERAASYDREGFLQSETFPEMGPTAAAPSPTELL